METTSSYNDYYRSYFLSAVYSHEERKIYSALRAVSNLMFVEIIPLLDLVIINEKLSPELKEFAKEIKTKLESNPIVTT